MEEVSIDYNKFGMEVLNLLLSNEQFAKIVSSISDFDKFFNYEYVQSSFNYKIAKDRLDFCSLVDRLNCEQEFKKAKNELNRVQFLKSLILIYIDCISDSELKEMMQSKIKVLNKI